METYSSKGQLKIASRKESLTGTGNPSYLARRIQHSCFTASTVVEIPKETGISVGLAVFQSEDHHYFLAVKRDRGKIHIYLEQVRGGKTEQIGASDLPDTDKISLSVEAEYSKYSFKYRIEDGAWKTLINNADAKILTTAVAGGFVGATVGPYVRIEEGNSWFEK